MATSRHTSLKAANACCSKVSPFKVSPALSWPIRVLLPPASTKPESWGCTIATILARGQYKKNRDLKRAKKILLVLCGPQVPVGVRLSRRKLLHGNNLRQFVDIAV